MKVKSSTFLLGLEVATLVTLHPSVFAIRISTAFVVVTLADHALFGLVLGLLRHQSTRPLIGPSGTLYLVELTDKFW